jgi:glutamate--cysteine ligase
VTARAISPERVAALRDAMHAESFVPVASAGGARIGAEVELLLVDAATRRPLPLAGPGGVLSALRAYGARNGWRETRTAYDTPAFDIPGTATVTFEPGAQVEISTVACEGPSALLDVIDGIVRPLRNTLAATGVDVVSKGIDPNTDIGDVPLQLHVERYERMTRYFDAIGPFGIRMMRQTMALQMAVDRGDNPVARWRLLNDLAPYATAIFANSRWYAGADTGRQSYRAHCWRMLDASRTGVVSAGGDPATEYATFALRAGDMFADGSPRSYETTAAESFDEASWRRHLTTLFPEVRPRGYFELRSCDAPNLEWYAAPIVFVAGLVYDAAAAAEAAMLAGESRALLRKAGDEGLRDESIARTARDLFQLALSGARRLGPAVVRPDHLERATAFYDSYTARGTSLADAGLAERATPAAAPLSPAT